MKRFRNAAGDLAEHVLMALALLGGAGTPTDVTKTIRAQTVLRLRRRRPDGAAPADTSHD